MHVDLREFRVDKNTGFVSAECTITMSPMEFQDLLDAGNIGTQKAVEEAIGYLAVLLHNAEKIRGEGILSRLKKWLESVRNGGNPYI